MPGTLLGSGHTLRSASAMTEHLLWAMILLLSSHNRFWHEPPFTKEETEAQGVETLRSHSRRAARSGWCALGRTPGWEEGEQRPPLHCDGGSKSP